MLYRVLLNTAKNTREQIYLKIQDFDNKRVQETNLLDINKAYNF